MSAPLEAVLANMSQRELRDALNLARLNLNREDVTEPERTDNRTTVRVLEAEAARRINRVIEAEERRHNEEEPTIPKGAPPVGARFTKRTARPWTAEDDTKHMHTVIAVCEVTERDAVGFRYVVVEVLENTDAPPVGVAMVSTGGAMAWFGLAAAMTRGDVIPQHNNEEESTR